MAQIKSQNAADSNASIESRSTTWAVVAFILSALLVAAVYGPARLPLAGSTSLGALAAWTAAAFSGLGFGASYYLESKRNPQSWRLELPLIKRIIDIIALSATIMMLCHLLLVAISYLFQMGFVGMTVDRYGGAVLAGGATAFVGTMASMIAAPDQAWWESHFSALGNSESRSGERFNLTLVLTGLAITALANYVGHDLERGLKLRKIQNKRLVTLLSWILAGIGLFMMGVGLVPDASNTAVHVGFASGMVVLFALFLYIVVRNVPGLPKDLLAFSAIVVIAIAVSILLWVPIGYYNLTGMEFVAAGFLFPWLIVFVRTASAYGRGIHQ